MESSGIGLIGDTENVLSVRTKISMVIRGQKVPYEIDCGPSVYQYSTDKWVQRLICQ